MLPIEVTNDEIRNTKAYKEYYAFDTREAAPKLKANARRKRSGSDTSITPPTVVVTPKLTVATKGKQPAKATKAKSPSAPSEVARTEAQQLKIILKRSRQQTHISYPGGSGTDEGTGSKPGVPDVPTDESEEELSWNSSDNEGAEDQEKVSDDDEGDEGHDSEEREEDNDEKDKDGDERDDDDEEGDGEEDQGLNIGEEERLNEEEEADELYIDVDINQGRGLQVNQEVKDSHVILTSINSDGQQESPSVSSQFVTNMLNPTSDASMESIFMTALTSVAPLPITAPTMTPSTVTTITTTSQAPIPPTPIPSEAVKVVVQLQSDRLPEVLARSSHSSRISYAVAADLSEMELKKILIEKIEETFTLKRRRDDDEDKDEEPSVGPDQGSKRRREGKEPESASTPSETTTKSAGRSTTGSKSRQASASESAFAEEPLQTTSQIEEPSHPKFKTGVDDQPLVQSSQHLEWFSQPKKPPSPDHYDKHALWEVSHWGRKRQQFYGFAVNRESARDVYSKRRIIAVMELKIVEWHSYKHLDWIMIRHDDDKLYKFKECDLERLRIQDIKDMLLLLVQGKVTNLTIEERFAFNVSLRMFTRSIVIQRRVKDLQLGVESYQKKLNLTKPGTYRFDLKRKEAYTAYPNPRGFIYQNKDKQNRGFGCSICHKQSGDEVVKTEQRP
nr:hypothetical protein [Tanacetum cinerariifolium]